MIYTCADEPICVYAIDQAAANSGICHTVGGLGGKPSYKAEKFVMDAKHGEKRLNMMSVKILNDLRNLNVDLLVMERPLVVHASGIILHELSGVIKEACQNTGTPYIAVHPTYLKQWATGSHNADKDTMLIAAHKRFGDAIISNDVADAAFLCEIGWHYKTGGDPGNELKRSIIKKLQDGPVKKTRKRVVK